MVELIHDGEEHETEEAVLLNFEDEKIWVPKSIILFLDDSLVDLPEWFVKKHDLEDYEWIEP